MLGHMKQEQPLSFSNKCNLRAPDIIESELIVTRYPIKILQYLPIQVLRIVID
jgi:hypothetical protein